MGLPEKQAVACCIGRVNIRIGKHAGKQHTHHTANAVAGEYIQRIVYRSACAPLNYQVTYHCRDNANSQRMRHGYIPGCRGIATKPTTAPIQVPIADGFLPNSISKNIQVRPAAAEAVVLVAKAITAK